MNKHTIFASVGTALLFATASFAQQVKTDYDHNAEFSQYKTYSWEKVQTSDTLWVDRIKGAVNAALTAKGWTPVESGGDVAILAIEMAQNHPTLDTYYNGFGGGWRWGDSEMSRPQLPTTRWAPWLSICSTRTVRS